MVAFLFSVDHKVGTHTEITRWAQGCDNLVIGLSVPYKVVTTLSQPCNRIVSLLHTGHNLASRL